MRTLNLLTFFKHTFSGLLICLFMTMAYSAGAECIMQITLTPSGQIRIQMVDPTPGSYYSWSTNIPGVAGLGTVALINNPLGSFDFNFNVLDAPIPCTVLHFNEVPPCTLAGFTPVFNSNNCSEDFIFTNTGGHRYWDFGDGTPVTLSDISPTNHVYPYPGGQFNVTCTTIVQIGNQVYIDKCTQPVQITCVPPPPDVTETLSCGILRLNVSAGNNYPTCDHYWEIRSSNNLLVTTFTGSSFNYLPTNINTYNTPSLKIRHVVTCGGNLVFDNTTSYSFLNQGIFAGDPIVVNDQVPLALTSALNNNQPVFPGNNWLGNLKIYLYGLLQVTSSLTIDGADISVLPCEGIDVGSGGSTLVTFRLNNGSIHNGCTETWRGIDLNSRVTFISSGESFLGANQAIRTSVTAAAVPQIDISHATFSDNVVGVLIRGNLSNSATTPLIHSSVFSSASVPPICGPLDPIIAGLSGISGASIPMGFAGVVASNSTNFHINPSTGKNNTFSNLANGILMVNSRTDFNIARCDFTNMQANAAFFNSGLGIWADYPNGGTGLMVSNNNTFANCQTALLGTGSATGNFKVNLNTITNCPTGIRVSNSNLSLFALSNTITNGSTGIFAGTCLAANISDNTISGENLGILVQQTPGCIVFHNTMSNSQVGLRFVGDCNSPEHVTCNIFNNCATGLLIDAGGRIGQQTSAGNRWMSPGYQAGTLIGAQHNGSTTDIMQSMFFTPQSGVQFPFTIVVTPPNLPTDWFNPGAASSACPAFTGDGTDDRSEQSADVASELQLFPNPNDGSFSLQIGRLADTETAAVSIYDLSGKLVRQLETMQSDLNLNLGPQAAGWYILSVQKSNAATIQHIKFFIQ
jgi:parallel beta-helix repeat protein